MAVVILPGTSGDGTRPSDARQGGMLGREVAWGVEGKEAEHEGAAALAVQGCEGANRGEAMAIE